MSAARRGWLLVLVAGVLAAVTSFGYLGGFLAPDADARGLPMVVVNLDRGAEVGATSVPFGDQMVDQLRSPSATLGDAVAWQIAPSRDDALRRFREDRAYAARSSRSTSRPVWSSSRRPDQPTRPGSWS